MCIVSHTHFKPIGLIYCRAVFLLLRVEKVSTSRIDVLLSSMARFQSTLSVHSKYSGQVNRSQVGVDAILWLLVIRLSLGEAGDDGRTWLNYLVVVAKHQALKSSHWTCRLWTMFFCICCGMVGSLMLLVEAPAVALICSLVKSIMHMRCGYLT